MEPANQKKLQEHLKAIAGILYQEAKTEGSSVPNMLNY